MEDLVSIIMPTYNCERFIAETIESVINQTYTNWEIWIVDDCSTDNTKDVVKRYQEKYNNINYIVLEKNSGAAIARNLAIEKSNGKYIAFLDSDDLWYPSKLEKQIKFMKENNYYFSYTNYIEIDENSNKTGIIVSGPKKISKKGMYCYCWPGCLTVIYDRIYVGNIQITSLKKNNDYAMWILVSQKAECYLLNEILAKYRRGRKGSISTHSYRKLIKWHYKLWRANGKNIFASVIQTILNLIFGFIKKIKYVKKEV